VEEAGYADKSVEVFEAFEARSHLEEELVGEPQEQQLAADAFCRTHSGYVLSNTKSVLLVWWVHVSICLISQTRELLLSRRAR
jgi:hypothetical protein